jgi:hypothetical protein
MDITVGMPVQGYLKRYFLWKENIENGKVVKLNYKSQLRMVLSGLLMGKIQSNNRGSQFRDLPKKYNDEIICKVPASKFNNQLIFFDLKGIRFFNLFLYTCFHEDLLFLIVNNKHKYDIDEVDTINAFMSELKIYDMITYEALKKASYRERKLRKIPLFRNDRCQDGPKPVMEKVSIENSLFSFVP